MQIAANLGSVATLDHFDVDGPLLYYRGDVVGRHAPLRGVLHHAVASAKGSRHNVAGNHQLPADQPMLIEVVNTIMRP